eukprot:GILJ01006979.1.p1 GENE.GILJ01006979.1~~GILJ01006979.1.p1  ORF type:complete len:160 (+),score=21.95 GILJ01006979.1:147-626(+)
MMFKPLAVVCVLFLAVACAIDINLNSLSSISPSDANAAISQISNLQASCQSSDCQATLSYIEHQVKQALSSNNIDTSAIQQVAIQNGFDVSSIDAAQVKSIATETLQAAGVKPNIKLATPSDASSSSGGAIMAVDKVFVGLHFAFLLPALWVRELFAGN